MSLFSRRSSSFQPAHSTLPHRPITKFFLDNTGPAVSDYVSRSETIADFLQRFQAGPLDILGSGWSGDLWKKMRVGQEKFLFTNGWPTCFRVRERFLSQRFTGRRDAIIWAEGGLPLSHLNQILYQRVRSRSTHR